MQQPGLQNSLNIELEKIPSMPHALLQLLQVIRDPEAGFTEITEIIQSDPALTTRVMSIANSGAFYQWNQSKDFNHLLVAMGMKMVKTITINAAVQQFFSQFNVDNEKIIAQFWQKSLTTASIAKALAHITGYPSEDEAYIAGLLHNIGELVCLMHNASEYVKQKEQQIQILQVDSISEFENQQSIMEQNFIGANIPEIGHCIISDFNQNSMLGDAILYQRESAEQLLGAPHLVQLVNQAHKLALLNESFFNKKETDNSQSETPIFSFVTSNKDIIFKEVSSFFGLNQTLLEEVLVNCHAEFLETAKKMGISVNDNNHFEFDNEKIQLDLAENVRTIALSSSLNHINDCRLDGRSEKELIDQILQNLKVLFGLSTLLYLTYDEDKQQLNGFPIIWCGKNNTEKNHEALLSQFNISLDIKTALPVQALIKHIPVTSNNLSEKNNISILDRQLMHVMNSDEMLCIPLLDKANNINYGVIIAGLSSKQLQKIKSEKGLLYEFSMSASALISQDRILAEQLNAVLEEQHSIQSLQIRKLVHEASNPISVIRNYLQVLSLKLADSEDLKIQGQLEILMEEVERVGNIVLRIRELPEKVDIDINKVDLNLLINQLVSIFRDSLFVKSKIVANLALDATIPLINSNLNSLKQILTNLLKNSVEAMSDGGTINIRTRDQVNFNGEQFIELRVSDSGPGIKKEVLNNLFNPVKSTKSGAHSGLGLSIIKNLVNDLGGTIGGSNLHSIQQSSSSQQENTGAEFIILLPRRLFDQ